MSDYPSFGKKAIAIQVTLLARANEAAIFESVTGEPLTPVELERYIQALWVSELTRMKLQYLESVN